MRAFLWTMLILLAGDVIQRAAWIVIGKAPERTTSNSVINLVFSLVFACWAYVLLFVVEVPHG